MTVIGCLAQGGAGHRREGHPVQGSLCAHAAASARLQSTDSEGKPRLLGPLVVVLFYSLVSLYGQFRVGAELVEMVDICVYSVRPL